MAHTQKIGFTQKRRVFLRVWESEPEDDGKTHYHARVGKLEIEGWVYQADRGDIKELVKRALKGAEELPERVAKAVDSVVNHLITVIQLGSTTAAAHAGFDFNENEGLSFTVEMFYGDNGVWTVEVRAVHLRYNGRHILTKRTTLSQVTTEALRGLVARVVRQAYNAS
jgi:hypothetical protein